MKVLYYDCFSGISGDMNIGALLDLGVDKDYLIKELSKLKVRDEFILDIKRDIRKGIEGTKFNVVLLNEHESEHVHSFIDRHSHDHPHPHGEGHVHKHGHEHEQHHYEHSRDCAEKDYHVHRNLKDISDIINSSDLKASVKETSIEIFRRVAEAEGKIHGKTIDEVHFHEVGATDSIVDIVGAAICLDFLKVDKIMCSSVELGGGFVKCAHGRFPVPAPATLEILKGASVKSGAVKVETTTPTGAAILAAVVHEFTDNMKFTIHKIGYGVGNRDTEIPNVLRVILGYV